jgi:hypothetical protein
VSASSKAIHEARSNASHTNSRRYNKHGSRVDNLEHSYRRNLSRNLDSSFLLVDERGNIMPKTPEAALVAAQAYLYTTQPTPGDPREHMNWAELQGLRLVGSKLTAREEEMCRNEGTHNPDQHAVKIVLGTEAGVDDLGHYHQNTTTARGTKEPEDPSLPNKRTTTKMKKKKWEHHALLTEFVEHPYLKDSNYPMTSRSMTGPRSHNHGS